MKNYFFVISETPINLLTIDLPPYIGVHDTHPLASERCTVFYGGGSKVQDFVAAVLAIYPDARATTSKEEAGEWLKQRHITPHKGGRTVKRSTDVTPETQAALETLRLAGISLGDLVEEAAQRKLAELRSA